MKLGKWLLVLAAILLAGCATVPMASLEMDSSAKTFTPPDGKANIYVVRASSFGGAISFQVIVDGKVVGSVAPATYYLVVADPGSHSIAATSNENSAKAKFDAEAGRNYFFEIEATFGLMTARASLNQIQDEEKGKQMVQGAKRAEGLQD
jgi:hypothetical protein